MGSGSSPSQGRSDRTSRGNDRRGEALDEYSRDRDESGGVVDADAGGFDGPVEATLTDDDLPGSMGVADLSPALDREVLAAASEADDAAAFAEAVFGEQSQAPRVGDPEAPARRAYPPPESGHEDRYGGVLEYDPEHVENWHQLGDPLAEGGVREEFMERGDTGAASFDADEVYVCQYCADAVGPDHPGVDRLAAFEDADPPLSGGLDASRAARHNEMAQYAAYDALGVDVPRHTYDADTDRLIAEGAGRGVEMTEIARADDDLLDRADRQEVVDKLAVAALFGNGDMHGGNVGVDEDGNVHTFDLDRGARRVRTPLDLRRVAQSRAATRFDFDTPVTDAEVSVRATEIATAAVVSGQVDAVRESVAAYDDLFERIDPQVDNVSKAAVIEGNLRAVAEEADEIHAHLRTSDLEAVGRL